MHFTHDLSGYRRRRLGLPGEAAYAFALRSRLLHLNTVRLGATQRADNRVPVLTQQISRI